MAGRGDKNILFLNCSDVSWVYTDTKAQVTVFITCMHFIVHKLYCNKIVAFKGHVPVVLERNQQELRGKYTRVGV